MTTIQLSNGQVGGHTCKKTYTPTEREAAEAKASLASLRGEAEAGRRRVEEVEAAALCRVCYANACDAAFIGCGERLTGLHWLTVL